MCQLAMEVLSEELGLQKLLEGREGRPCSGSASYKHTHSPCLSQTQSVLDCRHLCWTPSHIHTDFYWSVSLSRANIVFWGVFFCVLLLESTHQTLIHTHTHTHTQTHTHTHTHTDYTGIHTDYTGIHTDYTGIHTRTVHAATNR